MLVMCRCEGEKNKAAIKQQQMHPAHLFTPCPQSNAKERHSEELTERRQREPGFYAACNHHTETYGEKPQSFQAMLHISSLLAERGGL